MVVHILEVPALLGAVALDVAAAQHLEDFALWRDELADAEEIALQEEELGERRAQRLAVRVLEDEPFEDVGPLAVIVDDREVPIDARVEERVQEHADVR